MTGDEYEVLKDASSCNELFLMKHKKCGTIFGVKKRNFLIGQRCSFCKPRIGTAKTVALLNKHCDMTGYSVLEKKDILKQIRSVRYVYKLDEIKDINFGEWYNNSKDSLKNCKTLKK